MNPSDPKPLTYDQTIETIERMATEKRRYDKMGMNNPAFPVTEVYRKPEEDIGHYHGLTKREYFAAKAMQGLLMNLAYTSVADSKEQLVFNAVSIADALIRALEETKCSEK